jgi:DNA-binding NarL/FixJ family response regulator
MVGRQRRDHPIDTLTERERLVLTGMAEGRSNQGIATRLGVTPAAVEKHVTQVFAKLGLVDEPYQHRRVMAVLQMLKA